MPASLFILVMLVTAVALCGVVAGVRLSGVPRLSRTLVPASGAVTVAVCLFWIWPELASEVGWMASTLGLTAGCALLWFIDRYIYSVCPSCAHTHDHGHCAAELHGFATPLILATAVHGFLDGWGVVLSREEARGSMGAALLAGIVVHKLPEGLALGVILRAALASRLPALAWATAAELATVAGGVTGFLVAREINPQITTLLVSLTGGCFLYLGFHAMHTAPAFRQLSAPVARLFTRS